MKRADWEALEADLAEMERTDPVVAAAAERLNDAVDGILFRARHGIQAKRS